MVLDDLVLLESCNFTVCKDILVGCFKSSPCWKCAIFNMELRMATKLIRFLRALVSCKNISNKYIPDKITVEIHESMTICCLIDRLKITQHYWSCSVVVFHMRSIEIYRPKHAPCISEQFFQHSLISARATPFYQKHLPIWTIFISLLCTDRTFNFRKGAKKLI